MFEIIAAAAAVDFVLFVRLSPSSRPVSVTFLYFCAILYFKSVQ